MEDKVIVQKDLDSLFAWGKTWVFSFDVSKLTPFISPDKLLAVRFCTIGGEVISSESAS